MNNLIGRTVYYKAFFKLTDKLESEEIIKQKKCMQKEIKYERPHFLSVGTIEAIGQAGDGMNSAPCLIISDAKFVNKADIKKINNKTNAYIPLVYCFLDQVVSLDKIK